MTGMRWLMARSQMASNIFWHTGELGTGWVRTWSSIVTPSRHFVTATAATATLGHAMDSPKANYAAPSSSVLLLPSQS
ncbi:hypothetical protein OG21DRAFT_1036529 [Imleria badia]|nr:hypothetical protein OG21DRAFT_1036529 [Imleria badia]